MAKWRPKILIFFNRFQIAQKNMLLEMRPVGIAFKRSPINIPFININIIYAAGNFDVESTKFQRFFERGNI